jgi:hypothetical protein
MDFGSYHFFLAYITNCYGEERFDEWKRELTRFNLEHNLGENCALLGNTNIGCGLNSLTFLKIITMNQGRQLVQQVNNSGTSFLEMMNYVRIANGNKIPLQEILYPITTLSEVTVFLNLLSNNLPNNSCTIAKLNRNPDIQRRPQGCRNFTPGHSVVFNKDQTGKLWTIDPQQCRRKERDDNKMFKSFQDNCYISVSLMYFMSMKTPRQLQPIPANYPVQDFNRQEINVGYGPMDVVEDQPVNQPVNQNENVGYVPMDIAGGKMRKRNSRKRKNSKKTRKTRK